MAAERTEGLLRLDHVLVGEDAIGNHVVIQVREMLRGGRLLSRARRPGQAVDGHGVALDQAVREQRRKSEDHPHGEAPRIPDDRRTRDAVGVQLRDAVRRLPQQPLGGVFGPADPGVGRGVGRVGVGRREAEVPRVVDEADAGFRERGRVALRDAVRRREDDDVGVAADLPVVGALHGQVAAPAQVRVNLVDAAPRIVTRDERRDLERGMPEQQLEDAESPIPRGANDLRAVRHPPPV